MTKTPRTTMVKRTLGWLGLSLVAVSCASSGSTPQEPHYNIVKNPETAPAMGGVPSDKEAEVQLVLQQHDVSIRRCYNDVLTERHDRNFQGTVKLLISLGTSGRATDVKTSGGTLTDREVTDCLVSTIKSFEFPQLTQPGDVQYEYSFKPAY